MAKKISTRTVYNIFFDKYQKAGYISHLLKTASNKKVFEFEFDSISDVKDAKDFLSEKNINYRASSLNKKKVMVFP